MRTDGLRSPRGATTAIALVIAGFLLAWLCLRVAVLQLLPPASSVAQRLNSGNEEASLNAAVVALVQPDVALAAESNAVARQAAAQRPLDARPYLILSSQAAAAGDRDRSIALLEAGQRLDPRQRVTHILLLEKYLRAGKFAETAQQLSLLSRLINAANAPIADALVLMTTDPEMLPAVRRTLAQDPSLEVAVLRTLAKGRAEPNRIFDLASPRAIARGGAPDGWGGDLVSRLAENGQYAEARAVWRRFYDISDAAAAQPIFNPEFRPLRASAPFNWTLAAGSLGVAAADDDGLLVDYYGRDTGDLASQTLSLNPGRYHLSFSAVGPEAQSESSLSWQMVCATGGDDLLVNAPVRTSTSLRSVTADFAVPSTCPAQVLRLRGQAGEFPETVEMTISGLNIRPAAPSRSTSIRS